VLAQSGVKFSKTIQLFTLFVVAFLVFFVFVFLTIISTQSAYSKPSNSVLVINGMDVTLGPAINSTNVPLDTTITIDAFAAATVNGLHITPEVVIAYATSETTGPLTYVSAFYPDEPLKPATTYNVSVTVMDMLISWSFTTTPEPSNHGISFYLATYNVWISLSMAALVAAIVGLTWRFREKRIKEISNIMVVTCL
jgi:hypothetical protein